jgi:hypothetical protein
VTATGDPPKTDAGAKKIIFHSWFFLTKNSIFKINFSFSPGRLHLQPDWFPHPV